MSEDILLQIQRETGIPDLPFSIDVLNSVLILLEDICIQMVNKSLEKLGLSSPIRDQQTIIDADYARELNYDAVKLRADIECWLPMLNADQALAYNVIMSKIRGQEGGIMFLDAPGGTGKTFLTNFILAEVRSRGEIALAMASSGIAATLLDGGAPLTQL